MFGTLSIKYTPTFIEGTFISDEFGGAKLCEAVEVREYFINPKIKKESFGDCEKLIWISEIFHRS